MVLWWLGGALFQYVQDRRYLERTTEPLEDQVEFDWDEYLTELFFPSWRTIHLDQVPRWAAAHPFGTGCLGAPLALIAGAWLVLARGGRARRTLGILALAAGGMSVGLAILGWPPGGPALRLFPGPVTTLFGTCFAAALLLRAATGPGARTWPETAPGLLLAGALLLNVSILYSLPDVMLEMLLGNDSRRGSMAWASELWPVLRWMNLAVGLLLLFVPALILRRGSGFRPAFRALGRAVRHAPAGVVLAYLLVLVLEFLPIAGLLTAPFLAAGWVPRWTMTFPATFLEAATGGLETGLIVYVLVRLAGAIAEIGRREAYSPE
jgi:hypothetical protein